MRTTYSLSKKGELFENYWLENIIIDKLVFSSPIKKLKGKKLEITNNKNRKIININFVLYLYDRACKTDITEWTVSMAAVWFWMQKQDVETIRTTKAVTNMMSTEKQIVVAYKFSKHKEFRDLVKSNPALARILVAKTRNKKHRYSQNEDFVAKRATKAFLRKKQKDILTEVLSTNYRTKQYIEPKYAIPILKKFRGKNIDNIDDIMRLETYKVVKKLPRVNSNMINIIKNILNSNVNINTNMLLEVTARITKKGYMPMKYYNYSQQIIDVNRMAQYNNYNLPNKINSWAQIEKIHDNLIQIQNRKRVEEEHESYSKLYTPLLPGTDNIKFLDNRLAIEEEGRKMHHCVGMYWDYAEEGVSSIYHVTYGEEEATLEVSSGKYASEKREIKINQLYGKCNKRVSAGLKAMADNWFNNFSNQ